MAPASNSPAQPWSGAGLGRAGHCPVGSLRSTEPCIKRAATDRGHGMKWLMWALVAVVIAIGLALLAGKGDLQRFQRMRRM